MISLASIAAMKYKLRASEVYRKGVAASNAMQRETAGLNGQVHTYHNDGRRTMRAFSDVGMSDHAHVCRNLKTATVKRYVAPRRKPTAVREARPITVTVNAKGKEKRTRREIGTGAYDPARAIAAVGVRREVKTATVVSVVVERKAIVFAGGVLRRVVV